MIHISSILDQRERNDFERLVDTTTLHDRMLAQAGIRVQIEIHGHNEGIAHSFGNLADYILQPINMWMHIVRFLEVGSFN